MAHAHERGRQGVEHEPADEFVGRQGHGFALVGVAAVSIRECDHAVFDREYPVVRDRDAVGVAADVIEDGLRSREGALGVDHPLLFVELGDQLAKGRFVGEVLDLAGEDQFPVVKRLLKEIEELSPEDLRHGPDREQEVWVR